MGKAILLEEAAIAVLVLAVATFGTSATRTIYRDDQLKNRAGIEATAALGRLKAGPIPLASDALGNWAILNIPPFEKSELIAQPNGMKPAFVGGNFSAHFVYRDGRDCDPKRERCPDGSLAGFYVRNEMNVSNTISYAFTCAPNSNCACPEDGQFQNGVTWRRIQISPQGRSVTMSMPIGFQIEVRATSFRIDWVDLNAGRFYIQNLSARPNTIVYAFCNSRMGMGTNACGVPQ